MNKKDFEVYFTSTPKGCEEVHEIASKMAQRIDEACPDNRERKVALRKLKEAVIYAAAAIIYDDHHKSE